MGFHRLDSRFPYSTKVGGVLGNESPCDLLVSEMAIDSILSGRLSQELVHFLQLSSCSSKIRTIVAPYEGWEATPRDESFQTDNKGFGGEVSDQFEMHCLDGERDEHANVKLYNGWLADMSILNEHRSSVVNTNFIEH